MRPYSARMKAFTALLPNAAILWYVIFLVWVLRGGDPQPSTVQEHNAAISPSYLHGASDPTDSTRVVINSDIWESRREEPRKRRSIGV